MGKPFVLLSILLLTFSCADDSSVSFDKEIKGELPQLPGQVPASGGETDGNAIIGDSVPEAAGEFIQQGEEIEPEDLAFNEDEDNKLKEDLENEEKDTVEEDLNDPANDSSENDSSENDGSENDGSVDNGSENNEDPVPEFTNFEVISPIDLDFVISKKVSISKDHPKFDRCVELGNKLKKKALFYLKRLVNAQIHQMNGDYVKVDLIQRRNKVTFERGLRIARKIVRLDCTTDPFDEDFLFSQNHFINGSFELKRLDIENNQKWSYYSQSQTPGWRVRSADSSSPQICDDVDNRNANASGALEFQHKNVGVLQTFANLDGTQYAELDSHCSDGTKDTKVRIFQRVETQIGAKYKITFAAASRDQDGKLVVGINKLGKGKGPVSTYTGDLEYSFDLTGNQHLKNRELSEKTITFVAESNITEISFADIGKDLKKTYGILIDNILLIGIERAQ